jgi:hypothetical protein
MGTHFVTLTLLLVAAAFGLAQDKDSNLTPKQRSASKLAAKAAEAMQKQDWEAGIRKERVSATPWHAPPLIR